MDPADLERSANAALAAYDRRREHPFVRHNGTRAKFGARQSIQVRACNILAEIMEVPVPTLARQFGAAAGQVLYEALDDAQREIDRTFGDTDDKVGEQHAE